MNIARQTPIIVRDGQQRTITMQVIAGLLAEGLTPADCEVLALTADFYGFTIPELMAAALGAKGNTR